MIHALQSSVITNPQWIEEWLSAPRFRTYLDACHQDALTALYEWNVDLGQILVKDVAFFEIALRNAYDRNLANHWQKGQHWLFDQQSPVNRPIPRRTSSGKPFDANALSGRANACRTIPSQNSMPSHCAVAWCHSTYHLLPVTQGVEHGDEHDNDNDDHSHDRVVNLCAGHGGGGIAGGTHLARAGLEHGDHGSPPQWCRPHP